MPGKYFTPPRVTVLAGEPITWHNEDVAEHDVASVPCFVSGRLGSGASYTYAFATPGNYAFRCTIHAFMAGTITVAPAILEAPTGAVLAGQGLRLTGRVPVGTAGVAIERTLDGTTWQNTGAKVVPDDKGAFAAMVPAAEGAAYRAAVAGGTSPVVWPQVAARVPLAVARRAQPPPRGGAGPARAGPARALRDGGDLRALALRCGGPSPSRCGWAATGARRSGCPRRCGPGHARCSTASAAATRC